MSNSHTETNMSGPALAEKLFAEVLENFETLGAIDDTYGVEAVYDLWYLQHALLVGDQIDSEFDSPIMKVLEQLPSKEDFIRHVQIHGSSNSYKP